MPSIRKKRPAKDVDLLKLISAEFPEIEWQSYEHITLGWDHDVIILDNNIVFRFPNDNDYVASLSMEIEVLGKLKPLVKINIPNYKYIARDFSFAGYPIVPGELLSKKFLDNMTDPVRNETARQLAQTLTTLHTIAQDSNDFDTVSDSYMYKDQQEVKRQANQYLANVLSDNELTQLDKILHDVDELLAGSLPAVLIHGDVYSQHLLWDEPTKRLGLIDFSDMVRADPAIDFAELYEYGEAFVKEVYEIYKGPKDATFLDRAWIYQCWVGVYMMTDHFVYNKTTFDVAKETFSRIMLGRR